MLNLTPLLRPLFAARCRASRRWYTRAGAEQAQRRVLADLLRRAASTDIGRRYNFPAIRSAEAYAEAVPVMTFYGRSTAFASQGVTLTFSLISLPLISCLPVSS